MTLFWCKKDLNATSNSDFTVLWLSLANIYKQYTEEIGLQYFVFFNLEVIAPNACFTGMFEGNGYCTHV